MISNIVQRSGFFDPKLISGLQLWLDASDVSTLQYDGSNLVSTWFDKSGYGRDATAQNASRLSYVPNVYNGFGTVRSTSSSQRLQTSTFVPETFFGSGKNTVSIFAVWKHTGGGPISWRTFSTNDRIQVHTSSLINTSWNTISYIPIAIPSSTDLRILGLLFDGSNNRHAIYYGNSLQSSDQAFNLTTSALSTMFILGNEVVGANFDMCELLIYNKALSMGEIVPLRSYLSSKWRTP